MLCAGERTPCSRRTRGTTASASARARVAEPREGGVREGGRESCRSGEPLGESVKDSECVATADGTPARARSRRDRRSAALDEGVMAAGRHESPEQAQLEGERERVELGPASPGVRAVEQRRGSARENRRPSRSPPVRRRGAARLRRGSARRRAGRRSPVSSGERRSAVRTVTVWSVARASCSISRCGERLSRAPKPRLRLRSPGDRAIPGPQVARVEVEDARIASENRAKAIAAQ